MNNKWNSNFSWSKIPLPHNSAVCLFLIPYGFGMAVASGSVETCQLESIYQRMHVRLTSIKYAAAGAASKKKTIVANLHILSLSQFLQVGLPRSKQTAIDNTSL